MTKSRAIIAIVIFFSIQMSALVGVTAANYWSQKQAIFEVKQRISLDLSGLDLGTENTESVANTNEIKHYMSSVNNYLAAKKFPVRVRSINGINNTDLFSSFNRINLQKLFANDKDITLIIASKPVLSSFPLSYLGLAAAIVFFFYPWIKERFTQEKTLSGYKPTETLTQIKPLILVIDLRSKSLNLEGNNSPVALSNKPFCFYVALVKFCTPVVREKLIHHEEIPKALLEYADDTFKQLIKLGHTKRKQPDFSSNLDKTLSEIRAALDDVFEKNPLEKTPFYPPKAQGEGSRTKRHSYALEELKPETIKFIFG